MTIVYIVSWDRMRLAHILHFINITYWILLSYRVFCLLIVSVELDVVSHLLEAFSLRSSFNLQEPLQLRSNISRSINQEKAATVTVCKRRIGSKVSQVQYHVNQALSHPDYNTS